MTLWYGLAGAAAMLAVLAAAVAWGRPRSQRAALIAAIAWLASLAVQLMGGGLLPNFGSTVIDLAALIALLGLVWKPRAAWPTFALGAEALGVAANVRRLFEPGIHEAAYLTTLAVAEFGLLGAILFGVFNDRRAGRTAYWPVRPCDLRAGAPRRWRPGRPPPSPGRSSP